MAVLKLSAPWQIYYKELCLLFEQDEEVRIVYDTDQQIISIYVDNAAKADAMAAALPTEKEFGNVTLTIVVVPANKSNLRRTRGTVYEDLFYKNPIVNDVVTIDGILTNPITYVIFKKEVVQYFNDDLGDAHGMCSTLYQDIAKRIFESENSVHFCTSTSSSYAYTGCTCTTSDIRVGF